MAEMTTETHDTVVQEVESEKKKTGIDLNAKSGNTETTRSRIALLYIRGFFIVILLVFLIGYITHFVVKDYTDMLITVSGVLSGPLGFIVGYYFKASKE